MSVVHQLGCIAQHGVQGWKLMEAFLKHRLLPPQRPAKETVAVDALDLNMTYVASSHISLVKAIHTVTSESE